MDKDRLRNYLLSCFQNTQYFKGLLKQFRGSYFSTVPKPVLYIFSGLPGTGKTSLGRLLAEKTGAVYLRIDTIEQGLRDLCGFRVEGEGYRLSYRIARDNLMLGNDVIADSCNPIELTRREWEQTAEEAGGLYKNIEIICSDKKEHRARIEKRRTDIKGLELPDWEAVQAREYHGWTKEIIRIDTAGKHIPGAFDELWAGIDRKSLKP